MTCWVVVSVWRNGADRLTDQELRENGDGVFRGSSCQVSLWS